MFYWYSMLRSIVMKASYLPDARFSSLRFDDAGPPQADYRVDVMLDQLGGQIYRNVLVK